MLPTDVAAFIVLMGFVNVRMRLDGFGSGRSSVTLSMSRDRSGTLRSMGIRRRSAGVRALSIRVSGVVDWLLLAIAILGVLGIRVFV